MSIWAPKNGHPKWIQGGFCHDGFFGGDLLGITLDLDWDVLGAMLAIVGARNAVREGSIMIKPSLAHNLFVLGSSLQLIGTLWAHFTDLRRLK